MERLNHASHPHHSSSWGTLIGLFIILAVMLLGAYFALSARISSSNPTPSTLSVGY